MPKVVICSKHGGFSLSEEAQRRLYERGSKYIKAVPTVKYFKEDHLKNDASKLRHLKFCNTPLIGDLSSGKVLDENYRSCDEARADPLLIGVIEEMGAEAAGPYCEFSIVDVPDDAEWKIEEYDGLEWVAEKHRTWG